MNFPIALSIVLISAILLGYLTGSIMFSVIISKCCYKTDIRQFYSKNPGTTNTLRVLGKKAAIAVLFLDVFKIIVPTVIVWAIYTFALKDYFTLETKFNFANLIYLTCLFGILGHIYPVWFKFKGGKGVASSLGFYLCLSPFIGVLFALIMFIIVLITKYVSLGSIVTSWICSLLTLVPFINYFYLVDPNLLNISKDLVTHTINATFVFAITLIVSVLVTIKHKSNIIKIKNKTENKISFKSKSKKDIIDKESQTNA